MFHHAAMTREKKRQRHHAAFVDFLLLKEGEPRREQINKWRTETSLAAVSSSAAVVSKTKAEPLPSLGSTKSSFLLLNETAGDKHKHKFSTAFDAATKATEASDAALASAKKASNAASKAAGATLAVAQDANRENYDGGFGLLAAVFLGGAVIAAGSALFFLSDGSQQDQQGGNTSSSSSSIPDQRPAGSETATTSAREDRPTASPAEDLARLRQLKEQLERLHGDGPEVQQQRAEVQQQITDLETRQLAGQTAAERQVLERARVADAQANAGLAILYERVMPVVLQGDRVQRVVDSRAEAIRARVPQVIQEEIQGAFGEVTDALQNELPQVSFGSLDNLPPLSLILAGLVAPVQLKMLHADNMGRMALTGAMFGLDSLSLFFGWGKNCITDDFWLLGNIDLLHGWIFVDAASLGFTLAVSAKVYSSAKATLDEIQKMKEEELEIPPGSDPETVFRMTMQNDLMTGARAMLQFDRLTQSAVYRMLPVMSIFDFVWQAGGLILIFDTPSITCQAKTLLYWSRIRGMTFLVGLIPAVLGFGMTAVKVLVNSHGFGQSVLEAASDADAAIFPAHAPVFTVLVRSFLVRDSTDMASVELQVLRAEENRIQRARDKMRQEKERIERELVNLETRFAAASTRAEAQSQVVHQDSREREFLEQYRQAVDQALDARQTALTVAQAVASEDNANVALAAARAAGVVDQQTEMALRVAAAQAVAAGSAAEAPTLESLGDQASGLLEASTSSAAATAAAAAADQSRSQLMAMAQEHMDLADIAGTGGSGTFQNLTSRVGQAMQELPVTSEETTAAAAGEPGGSQSPAIAQTSPMPSAADSGSGGSADPCEETAAAAGEPSGSQPPAVAQTSPMPSVADPGASGSADPSSG
eukprot:TRINITY_DN5453_c0_g1_i1.p1 TRINITY_DN5453_c0_g1~~TRINITY_DN5453_c0_g1_i1.p1  ORF type:complete len:887 (+),score=212.12 TRINITY_DN5453_c0_g1_i1:27-2663(+)